MLNSEIGTYKIAEAIKIKPKLKVIISGTQIQTMINGDVELGNYLVISNVINCSKIIKLDKLVDNKVELIRDAKQVLSDIYGISKNEDWKLVYNPSEVWSISERLANKKKQKELIKFSLNEDTGHI